MAQPTWIEHVAGLHRPVESCSAIGFLYAPVVKGGVNLDHFGGAKVDQLVKG